MVADPRHLPAAVLEILAKAARDHDVTVEDLLSRSQAGPVSRARRDAVFFLREIPPASGRKRPFKVIAGYLNRDEQSARTLYYRRANGYSNARFWTAAELQIVEVRRTAGATLRAIAEEIGRTETAVWHQWKRLRAAKEPA